jgi:hypothetical protein
MNEKEIGFDATNALVSPEKLGHPAGIDKYVLIVGVQPLLSLICWKDSLKSYHPTICADIPHIKCVIILCNNCAKCANVFFVCHL